MSGVFVCTRCGCLWRLVPLGTFRGVSTDTWSLFNSDQRPCSGCDNSPEFIDLIERACERAMPGWQCKRTAHADGPCAAIPS